MILTKKMRFHTKRDLYYQTKVKIYNHIMSLSQNPSHPLTLEHFRIDFVIRNLLTFQNTRSKGDNFEFWD